ncbi:putative cell survival pathways protein [Alternaria novae-zelandiae]|uniref:oxidative stress survival, Svf1-like protein n=1 Tax=Alternaria rosae TaxID=1187941 RepID=UPI001E8D0F64|nr:oxidative stress survival, Svf1-like protein [Alternaria rosae]XP_049192884.1 putative cell survival pathways protein [Alternaria metachromatica]XP_049215447.1 putative cell survival pathways protein [Alternaria viburni]XP_049227036.1 putative cell survival pathways protein [Alternaria triticimaculans]XP_049232719.1 putative cell survival pathways protein [Alternaria ethzedia]XP_049245542.1 putative cell survival pathways protein [Alternaria hordeiaustralica]XP_049251103.1 putative cell su
MFSWAKSTLAAVAGTQEPEYGPDAIQPVGKKGGEPAYTELAKKDLKWVTLDYTNVETQTFYLFTDAGHKGFLQVIYNNIAGLRVTVQFNCKLFYPNNEKPFLWASDPVSNYGFDEDQHSFYADGVSIELSEDGSAYTIKAAVNDNSMVNVKFTRTAPGFMGGKDGTTNYGTDPKAPWGSMHHHFWPRCSVEGSIITKEGEVDVKGRGMLSHALQGMKPHHAAARWNFVNFQSPSYSAILMEFTTPASYASTVVRVAGIATDGKLLFANTEGDVKHTETKQDETGWPEPTSASYHWVGKTEDGKEVTADLAGALGKNIDRVDVMAEVPGFIKTIVASAAGTKPYIYQYAPKMTIKVKVGDEVKEEEGTLFTEATFIS